MKPFIRTIPALGLAVLLSLIVAGCDLGGNGEQQPMPPPQEPGQPEPGQPGQPATPPTYPPPDEPGSGQQQPMPPPEPGQPATPPTYPPPDEPGGESSGLPISDMDLERAASAYVVIAENERKVQESMEQTEDDAAKQNLQASADQRMVQAVQDAGLSVERFTSIMQRVRTDEELGERFQEKVQQLQ
ncbi:MAG: DUF4168 domain-containing protein [Thermodesulfobacteriota bacterium]